jgi:hypothetical protein
MAMAYYSTALDRPAEHVWSAIRSFDDYAWSGTGIDAQMEEGRSGDAVGGVRRIASANGTIRQRLLAHSDVDRSYTYEFCPPIPFPVRDYRATLRITPVTDRNHAFVEWSATFDCADDERDRWVDYFEREGFARWLGSLREVLTEAEPSGASSGAR